MISTILSIVFSAVSIFSSLAAPPDVVELDDISEAEPYLTLAILTASQPPEFRLDPMPEGVDMDIRNVFHSITSEHPELKYAYDLSVELSDGALQCEFSYMPYRTGDWPEGFSGVEAGSLAELIEAARSGLASGEPLPVRITNAALTVDDMNKALQQVGGGYILCQLSRDGTEIVYTPQNNLSHSDALAKLSEIDALAEGVFSANVTDGMTQREAAEVLYTCLTETVRYDHRYYSDRANMPFDSQTAYGALHDGLAICGGYAQALQALFEKAGIPCYTVSGSMGSEYHMWNIAYLDGEWCYFDATSDRGRADYWFNYFAVGSDQLTNYEWDSGFVSRLTGE